MRLAISVFLSLLFCSSIHAQKLTGTWVMAYIKAKQPVYTMVEKNGEMVLDENPVDSTITYNAGLMSLKILSVDSAVSYSWDGEETWDLERAENEIRFNGPLDTLYGNFNGKEALILRSTIDEIPIEYVFSPLKFKKNKLPLDIENTSWSIAAEESFLNDQSITFHADSVLTSVHSSQSKPGEYYIHPLDDQYAIEYVVNTPKTYLGIIYLTEIKKKRIKGVFFPVKEEGEAPQRTVLQLTKRKK